MPPNLQYEIVIISIFLKYFNIFFLKKIFPCGAEKSKILCAEEYRCKEAEFH